MKPLPEPTKNSILGSLPDAKDCEIDQVNTDIIQGQIFRELDGGGSYQQAARIKYTAKVIADNLGGKCWVITSWEPL